MAEGAEPILTVRGLSQRFETSRGLFRPAQVVEAVRNVDLDLHRGETLALVGESGSGKTTLGRALIGLREPTAGRVTLRLEGETVLTGLSERQRRDSWRAVRMVFQDPMTSLNPRMTVFDIIADPLRRLGHAKPSRTCL